jgi:hypothetical protein
MIDGSLSHHTGKPTNIMSYWLISSTVDPMAGLELRSFISTELLLLLSCQFRSALVYGISGLISNKSAPMPSASLPANFAVTPLAEKYATNVFLMIFPPDF